MKRKANGVWLLSDDEMFAIRTVFAFADIEQALTQTEKEVYKKILDNISIAFPAETQILFEDWTDVTDTIERWEANIDEQAI